MLNNVFVLTLHWVVGEGAEKEVQRGSVPGESLDKSDCLIVLSVHFS